MTTTTHSSIYKHGHGLIKHVSREQREFSFVATRYEVDRDGEVVIPSGLDVRPFLKNPTVLAHHDRFSPIGRVVSLELVPVDGQLAWVGRARIDPPGTSDVADQAYRQLASGSLGGISIGFGIVEESPRPVLPGQTGVTYTKTQLMEISLVTIPSCANCVVLEKTLRRKDPVMNRCECDKTTIDWDAINRSAESEINWQGINNSASRPEINVDSNMVNGVIATIVPMLVTSSLATLAATAADRAFDKLTGKT